MTRLKVIYAAILTAIYVAASLASSLDILTCDHPHHAHIHSHTTDHTHVDHLAHSCCHCHAELLFADAAVEGETVAGCCDHDHNLLGENYTDFIVAKERDDNAIAPIVVMLSEALTSPSLTIAYVPECTLHYDYGDESTPLEAAIIEHHSLRAPPQLA